MTALWICMGGNNSNSEHTIQVAVLFLQAPRVLTKVLCHNAARWSVYNGELKKFKRSNLDQSLREAANFQLVSIGAC
jgi:hypothetical protein